MLLHIYTCIIYSVATHIFHYRVALSDCSVLGSVRTVVLESAVRRAILHRFNIDVAVTSAFDRAVIRGKTYHSKCYRRTSVRNSYTVEYKDGDIQKFGYINFFVSLASSTIALITPLIPTSLST